MTLTHLFRTAWISIALWAVSGLTWAATLLAPSVSGPFPLNGNYGFYFDVTAVQDLRLTRLQLVSYLGGSNFGPV
ncbi:hypothetical protein CCO03_06655 [Comamonas serinivorans]|uniref:Uncharacterized protein n=1 Tax=Comamonas serinivorans TaxID=1082851 RepID=A0A1Y0ELW1_9BURK|nr:hypothetical protein [Comamonas serinivorans]ARU04398.1 hypothetical protein CCO03_06655 [Comamonas serinivorans]